MAVEDAAQKAQLLNSVYAPLEQTGTALVRALTQRGYAAKLAYYGGHYRLGGDGAYHRDCFPLPVVEVAPICDIELNLDGITVSTKLSREDALRGTYGALARYPFEAYGVEDFTSDFYRPGMPLAELKQRIQESGEQQIGFSFCFVVGTDTDTLCALVQLLSQEGFCQ